MQTSLLGTGRRLTGLVWVCWRVLIFGVGGSCTPEDGNGGTAAQQRRATTINALPRRNLKEWKRCWPTRYSSQGSHSTRHPNVQPAQLATAHVHPSTHPLSCSESAPRAGMRMRFPVAATTLHRPRLYRPMLPAACSSPPAVVLPCLARRLQSHHTSSKHTPKIPRLVFQQPPPPQATLP